MKIKSLKIENFRAIRHFAVSDLQDMVIVAGPNGCGKSSILDAVRLLKSTYGGYGQHEWRGFFDEFGIAINDPHQMSKLYRDPTKSVRIQAEMQLSTTEKSFLRENVDQLLERQIWPEVAEKSLDEYDGSPSGIALAFPGYRAEVLRRVSERRGEIISSLLLEAHPLSINLDPSYVRTHETNSLMTLVFKTYDPENIGVIDFHGAFRTYGREAVGGVQLSATAVPTNRDSLLYNYAQKYARIKSTLANDYVRHLVSKDAGDEYQMSDLAATMSNLFTSFFPDKRFDGVRPMGDGTMTFPVRLASGEEHDLDDLSSGEKEVVYGYLRLRNDQL